MNKRVDQGRATRDQLVAVATELFGAHGYDGTSIDAVLERAGVSRGSLYHHFPNKEALFEASLAAVEARIGAETVAAASDAATPVDALRAGALAWIRLAGDPVVRRIVLLDAPSVLGWERWREIEQDHALGMLTVAVQAAADEGRVPPELVQVLAHMLLAMVNEVALLVARSPDLDADERTAEAAVDEVLSRLLGAPAAGPA